MVGWDAQHPYNNAQHPYNISGYTHRERLTSKGALSDTDLWRLAVQGQNGRRQQEELRAVESTCVWCGQVVTGDLDEHEESCTS